LKIPVVNIVFSTRQTFQDYRRIYNYTYTPLSCIFSDHSFVGISLLSKHVITDAHSKFLNLISPRVYGQEYSTTLKNYGYFKLLLKFTYYSVWDTFLLTAYERRVFLNHMYTGY